MDRDPEGFVAGAVPAEIDGTVETVAECGWVGADAKKIVSGVAGCEGASPMIFHDAMVSGTVQRPSGRTLHALMSRGRPSRRAESSAPTVAGLRLRQRNVRVLWTCDAVQCKQVAEGLATHQPSPINEHGDAGEVRSDQGPTGEDRKSTSAELEVVK